MARELSKKEWLVLLCGHYEGVDERALAQMDMEVSIGDLCAYPAGSCRHGAHRLREPVYPGGAWL